MELIMKKINDICEIIKNEVPDEISKGYEYIEKHVKELLKQPSDYEELGKKRLNIKYLLYFLDGWFSSNSEKVKKQLKEIDTEIYNKTKTSFYFSSNSLKVDIKWKYKKIYIAGFDVFYRNAKEIGEKMKNICKKYGFIGLFPLDNEIKIDGNPSKDKIASLINIGNLNYINNCDIIVANLNTFRGAEPDSGTCFECGYGKGLGKLLYGYIEDNSSIADKIINNLYKQELHSENGVLYDNNDMSVEDFDSPLNLMLSQNVKLVVGDFENCIKQIRRNLNNKGDCYENVKSVL